MAKHLDNDKNFTPDARIRFLRGQVIDLYNADGSETVVQIDKGQVMDCAWGDEVVTIKMWRRIISIPRKEVFFLTWLENLPKHGLL